MKAEHPCRAGLVPVVFRRWEKIDHLIVRCPAFSYRGRVVLVALLSFANDSGLCWPSLPRLAKEAALSLATTKRALAELLGAAIVTRAGRSVFQLDLARLTSVLAEPDRLTCEPMHRLTGELSIGSPVSREDPPHPFLNFKKLTHSVGAEPIVCVLDKSSEELRLLHVATAFALPNDRDGHLSIAPKLREAIAVALQRYTPAVLRRAVELARKQQWRHAELGAWCFTDETFLALVKRAQDETRVRTRAPRTTPATEPLSSQEAARASANVLRTLGVKRAG